MGTSVAVDMKILYDDGAGTPVDITDLVMSIGDVELKNVLQPTDGFNSPMPEFTPTGRGDHSPIEFGGIYKTGTGSIDALFANRIPEDVNTPSRTLTYQWLTGRTLSVETHLSDFKRSPNKDNGITKFTVTLQPSGDVTDVPV